MPTRRYPFRHFRWSVFQRIIYIEFGGPCILYGVGRPDDRTSTETVRKSENVTFVLNYFRCPRNAHASSLSKTSNSCRPFYLYYFTSCRGNSFFLFFVSCDRLSWNFNSPSNAGKRWDKWCLRPLYWSDDSIQSKTLWDFSCRIFHPGVEEDIFLFFF